MRSIMFATCLLALCATAVLAQDQSASQSAPDTQQGSQDSAKTIRIGGNVMQASLLKQVQPVYPAIAKTAKISGTVVLHAVIGTDGKIADLQYVSGPPLLMKSAMDAVRQWEYKPTMLNGEPVRVDTTISVVFTLGNNSTDSSETLADTAPPIDPQFRADSLQLLELMYYRETAESAMRQMSVTLRPQLAAVFPMTPNRDKILDAYFERLSALSGSGELTDMLIRTYAKYFSDEDIKGLTDFFQSPLGRRYATVSPQLLKDLEESGQRIGARRGFEIMLDLCKEYPELQGEAKFCPASTKKESSLLDPGNLSGVTARP